MKQKDFAFFKVLSALVATLMIFTALPVSPAQAATSGAIEASIVAGLDYLKNTQLSDGSWGGNESVGAACAVVTKFEDRAKDLGYSSAFNPTYPYVATVELAYDYIFSKAYKYTIGPQPAGDPDTNGNGYGVYFASSPLGTESIYETALCMMAMSSSNTPGRANDAGLDFDGNSSPDTFLQLTQESVDLLAWAQNDSGTARGGWRYGFNTGDSDGSVSGFAVLGLAYAESFSATVPAFVRTEMNYWVNYIQSADGGAGYTSPGFSNSYRTGHLLTHMAFLGDTPATPRMNNALSYIEDNWTLPPADGFIYLSLWSQMKGLVFSGVDLLDLDGGGTRNDNWFNAEPTTGNDLATYLIGQQLPDGHWPATFYEGSNDALSTTFALLVLEKAAPQLVDSDDDGVVDNLEGTGDRDGDGIADNVDYDPTGYFYDETNGQIIPGGSVSVTGPGAVALVANGSAGYYEFNADETAGTYTIAVTLPSGYQWSDTCLRQDPPAFDPTGGSNPTVLGSGEFSATGYLASSDCSDFYLTFNLATGDPEIFSNNFPIRPIPASTAVVVPATGFAPNRITALPKQKVSYAQSDLWLEIPKLGVQMDIVGVPAVDGGWDVSWLGKNAGWLEGSAFPTWEGNSVVTGHVWNADNTPGLFRNINTLWWGDEVIVHAFGQRYVFEVRSVTQISPTDIKAMMKHEELPWITLVTCSGYDEASNSYKYRELVRAVLVKNQISNSILPITPGQ